MSNHLIVQDEETKTQITIENPNFYGPAIPTQDNGYTESGCVMNISGKDVDINFTYGAKPTDAYALDMWNTIDEFENKAWSQKSIGLTTGFPRIDKGFGNGIHPGFIIIAGDSNLGKTGFLSQMAWQISVSNNDKAYVMDFSLDDAMADKLSRVAACTGKLIINAVKTPLEYTKYPLMLVRRKNALISIRNNANNYRAYDATFSTYIEDIEQEIQKNLIYFKSNNIDKQVVVCIDNFHDLNTQSKPNMSDKEKYDFMAQWCADIAIKYDIVVICTGELKKLNSTRRPMLDDIRELTFKIAC